MPDFLSFRKTCMFGTQIGPKLMLNYVILIKIQQYTKKRESNNLCNHSNENKFQQKDFQQKTA